MRGFCGIAVLVAVLFALGMPRQASAQPARPVPDLPALPLSVAVAVEHDRPVVSPAWVRAQVAEAERLLAPHGVHVRLVRRRPLDQAYAALETARDRDALADLIEPRVINVFVVRSLRDVDDPRLLRMGVRWRLRRDVRKTYVIVAASAMPTTLAHELGHYFGNGHSQVDNNIMSYRRSDPNAVRFDAKQGARMRHVVRGYLRSKKLQPASAFEQKSAAGTQK